MPADWIYSGYRMTVISNQEELAAQGALKGGTMKFYPQSGLQAAGARYVQNQAPWTSNVVVDRELITGQNPASAPALADKLLQALQVFVTQKSPAAPGARPGRCSACSGD